MQALFSERDQTLTSYEVLNAYVAAYRSVHEADPECEALENGTFVIGGVNHNRRWMIFEVERLHEVAFLQPFSSHNLDKPAQSAYQKIRRSSRF